MSKDYSYKLLHRPHKIRSNSTSQVPMPNIFKESFNITDSRGFLNPQNLQTTYYETKNSSRSFLQPLITKKSFLSYRSSKELSNMNQTNRLSHKIERLNLKGVDTDQVPRNEKIFNMTKSVRFDRPKTLRSLASNKNFSIDFLESKIENLKFQD